MNSEMKYNALHSIAKRCNKAIKGIDKNDLPALTEAFNRFAVDVKLLGFTMLDMKIEIGVINGVLKNRRLD